MGEVGSVWKAEEGVEGNGGYKFEIIPDCFPFHAAEYFEILAGKEVLKCRDQNWNCGVFGESRNRKD